MIEVNSILLKTICKKHKPKNAKMGYMEHQAWIDEMYAKGERQKQCPECGSWLFKCEM